ncbi:ATP-binding protein [Pseudomonas bubulae]|uniref:ATP-binding protein n=1 Tax=Pseudomonas bubulae TaxID=2316085 RepID=UPI0030ADAF4D
MKFVGGRELNGFVLKEPFVFDKPLAVLTGKNGSGKTRFLESLGVHGGTDVYLNGEGVRGAVKYFACQDLMPKINGGDFEEGETHRLLAMKEYFRRHNTLFDCSEAKGVGDMWLNANAERGVDFLDVHRIVRNIAEALEKKPSDLSVDELTDFYSGEYVEMFGVKNLQNIFGRYKRKLNENSYAQWKSDVQGEKIHFVRAEDVEKVFGREPWLILNEILDVMFHGKIKVIEPSLKAVDVTSVVFCIKETGAVIGVDNLSSGEKTLLWVALAMFYTQYTVVHTSLPPKLLLLDEPDAFLHPSMVLQLIEFLNVFAQSFSAQVIITTHSPTTVALAPEGAVYLVENGVINALEKDSAIAFLLAGVSQISINPYNRRQVFVESSYDADVYQSLYGALSHSEQLLDPKITLTFISSGPKMPSNQLEEQLRSVFGKSLDEEKILEFLKKANGVGCRTQVEGVVGRLTGDGSRTIRGLIDWDGKNKPSENVIVLGEGKAYAIENIVLDPVCIMSLMHVLGGEGCSIDIYCGRGVPLSMWLKDQRLLQESIDWFVKRVLRSENSRDVELQYVGGFSLLSDSRYLHMNGHDLARIVMCEFDVLRSAVKNKSEKLNGYIVERSMLALTEGKFIPVLLAESFSKLQN